MKGIEKNSHKVGGKRGLKSGERTEKGEEQEGWGEKGK